MKINWLLAFTLTLILFNCGQQGTSVSSSQKQTLPNVILIMADDLGIETLSCYGGESYKTPHLDKLAAEGMQFKNCYATPLCTPSRVQIMTGKYNFRNYLGFGLLDPKEITFGHLMKEAGYQTCVVGKWQLYGNKKQHKLAGGRIGTLPQDAGFDDWCLWQVKDLGSRYKSPTLSIKGKEKQVYEGKYGPDLFVDYLESFIEKSKKGNEPFFAYYPMVLTHDPFQPTPENEEFADYDPTIHPRNDTIWFGDMMTYMDKLIGRIVQKVESLGIRENTLILFVGDNGTDRKITSLWNGQKIKGNKGYTTKAGTHVPFIANWKGKIQAGVINHNLVDFTDFLPSLLDAAQKPLPPGFITDGVSFFPQLLGKPSQAREWVFCHYDPRWGKYNLSRYVQNHQWKLYESGELYDIVNDPFEKKPIDPNNVADEVKAKVKNFRNVLSELNLQ